MFLKAVCAASKLQIPDTVFYIVKFSECGVTTMEDIRIHVVEKSSLVDKVVTSIVTILGIVTENLYLTAKVEA